MAFELIRNNFGPVFNLAKDNYYSDSDSCKNSFFDSVKILASTIYELGYALLGQEEKKVLDNLESRTEYKGTFYKNFNLLKSRFDIINEENVPGNKVALYFSSILDHNGYLLSSAASVVQLNNINNLQENGFTTYTYLVSSKSEIDGILNNFRKDNISVDLILIAAHGFKDGIELFEQETTQYHKEFLANSYNTTTYSTVSLYDMYFAASMLGTNSNNLQFPSLKSEYDIVFYSCSVGKGDNSFAEEVAKQNPNAHVYGATSDVFFSDIKFSLDPSKTSHYVEAALYHEALFGALPLPSVHEMKEFF